MSMVLSNALSQVSLFGGALELPAAASIAPGASSPTGASVLPSPPANGRATTPLIAQTSSRYSFSKSALAASGVISK